MSFETASYLRSFTEISKHRRGTRLKVENFQQMGGTTEIDIKKPMTEKAIHMYAPKWTGNAPCFSSINMVDGDATTPMRDNNIPLIAWAYRRWIEERNSLFQSQCAKRRSRVIAIVPDLWPFKGKRAEEHVE
ncbi:hypothetical protein GALMADRAFT_213951 [Galerina marginata CBS 339.88]|uniref:Uncharacterized protein n=1 Tax=Galerina marginata (strain CBS 339.88) TaxID=685588 RepID=A0A067SK09_GALM3|nr:hypothetical protein GALMADRAFT_213951 [Galerina marginata CBS 339.88]